MSNINANRLDFTLTQANIDAVLAAMNSVHTEIPGLTGLTVEERMNLPKINVSNKVFVEDTINVAVNNPQFVPAFVDATRMQTDLQLFEQLDALTVQSRRVTELLEDTQMLAGSESYVHALALYRFIGAAAQAGVPGADSIFDQLKARFENMTGGGQGTTEKKPAPPEG